MRFTPAVVTTKPVTIRLKIPGDLYQCYVRASTETGLDVSKLMTQALEFAAGEPEPDTKAVVKMPRNKKPQAIAG